MVAVKVEVWSDTVCPWCYIGKRRMEKAIAQLPYADEIEITWRSFQLDPSQAKGEARPTYEALAKKYGGTVAQMRAMTEQVKALGADEGLDYDFDNAVMANTFDGHRLSHLARTHGLGAQMHERLMRAHLIEGEVVDDIDTLVRLGAEIGVPADEAREVLNSDLFARDVLREASDARSLGANGVPFFVLDRRYGISGAQPVEAFLSAFDQAHNHVAA